MSSMYSTWGDLFGLKASDLTTEQLSKISFEKLIEFLDDDSRVEDIVCEKFNAVDAERLRRLKEIKNPQNFVKLVKAYNNKIRALKSNNWKEIKQHYYYRRDYVFWSWLDEDLRLSEIREWSEGKESIVDEENVDFPWLYQHHDNLAKEITDNLLSSTSKYSGYRSGYYKVRVMKNLLPNLPKDEVARVYPKLSKTDKDTYLNILSNPNTPDDYIVSALKILSKKVGGPIVNVKITEPILRELAPITRLEALENIVKNSPRYYDDDGSDSELSRREKVFDGITEETLRSLLFSAVVKYQVRVESLIKNMKTGRFIK